MKYTGPKFKWCRREGKNLFGRWKYDIRKNRTLPGQSGKSISRLSEYGKLLRNKQALKRMYLLSESKFKKLVMTEASNYSKNEWVDHDKAVVQFLERRLDSILLKAGFAKTIMQARQMANHEHFRLNGEKHGIPSYYVNKGDKLELKDSLKKSPLYMDCPINNGNHQVPSWIKVNKSDFSIEILDLPDPQEVELPVDVLKVIEFYARS